MIRIKKARLEENGCS
jgi:Phosphotransferase enzyme family